MTDTPEDLVTVRDAREDERDAIRELTLRAYAPYAQVMVPAAWAALERALRAGLAWEQPAVQCVVAERDGALVGSVLLYPPAADAYGGAAGRVNWPEVRLLAVAPEARGQGVGRALMDECVRRARRAGATQLGLHTSRSMGAAVRMYERMGFVRAPEQDFQPEGAELVQAYRLSLDDLAAGGEERQ
jgi:GNAT superfamily N-acetyltransferase